MPRCAFLTLAERGEWVIDDEHALPALEARGWRVETLPWDRPDVQWDTFDLVVIRSTWDYWDRPERFLEALTAIDNQTRLANPLPLVRWNLSKRYLAHLERSGISIVPTRWVDALAAEHLEAAATSNAGAGFVVKPQVGASGIDTFRCPQTPLEAVLAQLRGRAVMIQPFRPQILTEGEVSLFYFAGRFSHAIVKRPAAGEFRSQEERGAVIEPVEPSAAQRQAAERALAVLDRQPLYARADLLTGPAGAPELMELELIEPSLYFRTDPAAREAFADAVERWR